MAERMVRRLIDDLDGTEIENGSGERVVFTLRGATYQIDLSPANVKKLDKALKPFIDAAVRVRRGNARYVDAAGRTGRPKKTTASKARRGTGRATKETARTRTPNVQPAAIREWARRNGHQMSERGRLSSEIVEAFKAAN
jgi:Lsr2